MSLREGGPMVSPKRILVLGTSVGGGDWPPLAAVTVGLHQAGHAVQCFGDPAIAQEFTAAGIAIEVVPAADTLSPSPFNMVIFVPEAWRSRRACRSDTRCAQGASSWDRAGASDLVTEAPMTPPHATRRQ